MGSKSWILIGIIFLIILAFIAVLWENVFKYVGLSEVQKTTMQNLENNCKNDPEVNTEVCLKSAEFMLEALKRGNSMTP